MMGWLPRRRPWMRKTKPPKASKRPAGPPPPEHPNCRYPFLPVNLIPPPPDHVGGMPAPEKPQAPRGHARCKAVNSHGQQCDLQAAHESVLHCAQGIPFRDVRTGPTIACAFDENAVGPRSPMGDMYRVWRIARPEPVCPNCLTNRQDYCDSEEGLDTPDCPECGTASSPSWRTGDGTVYPNDRLGAAWAHPPGPIRLSPMIGETQRKAAAARLGISARQVLRDMRTACAALDRAATKKSALPQWAQPELDRMRWQLTVTLAHLERDQPPVSEHVSTGPAQSPSVSDPQHTPSHHVPTWHVWVKCPVCSEPVLEAQLRPGQARGQHAQLRLWCPPCGWEARATPWNPPTTNASETARAKHVPHHPVPSETRKRGRPVSAEGSYAVRVVHCPHRDSCRRCT